MTFQSPKYDYCLKALFENRVVREGFISDILGILSTSRTGRSATTFIV